MAVVIGLFGDAQQLERALERLRDEGFGEEVVREELEEDDGTAARDSDLGLAPGANQAGSLTEIQPSSDLTRFELTDEERDFLGLALQHGAEMVAVDTERVDEVVALLERMNAQQIRDPR